MDRKNNETSSPSCAVGKRADQRPNGRVTKLRELKKMADLHLISYAEYEKAKDGILRAMSDGTFNDG